MKLNRVNNYLANIEPIKENEVLVSDADVMKNIVANEIQDITRLSKISSELITYLSRDIAHLSRKEQQSLWRDVEAVNARKEDWVFKIAQEANKNGFINKILDIANQGTEKVISDNGEVFDSSISNENRAQLSAILVDLLNDSTRRQ
jgi:hypothetical protein